jgi:lysophospholipase L1-like esterase
MKRQKFLVAVGVALVVAVATALPAQAAKPLPLGPTTYAALGDSFAAGFGAGTSVNGGQTAQAYPVVLAGPNVTFLAVWSGGTTGTVTESQVPHVPATAQQVTLTVGGNDLGFVDKATACFQDPSKCGLTQDDLVKLAALPVSLKTTIAAIHEQAPAATIYVTGYPLLFQAAQTPNDTGSCVVGDLTVTQTGPLAITEAQADALDAAAVASTAVRSASRARRTAPSTSTRTARFMGHGLCGDGTTSPVPNPVLHQARPRRCDRKRPGGRC